MAGQGSHITALVRTHAAGDEEAFYSVALQVAAREARQGHHHLASEIKKAVETSRSKRRSALAEVTAMPRPQGEVSELVEVSRPRELLRDLVIAPALGEQIRQVIRLLVVERGGSLMQGLVALRWDGCCETSSRTRTTSCDRAYVLVA